MYKVVIIIAVIILGLGGYFYTRNSSDLSPQTIVESVSEVAENENVSGAPIDDVVASSTDTTTTHKILYTAAGYEPKELSVKVGDTVVWINQATTDMWPATAMHPTHTVYPGSDITKCTEADTTMLFDACSPIKPRNAYRFVFTEEGVWRYHDHLSTRNGGTITVTK